MLNQFQNKRLLNQSSEEHQLAQSALGNPRYNSLHGSPMYQTDHEASQQLRGQMNSTLVQSGTLQQILSQDIDKIKVNNSFDAGDYTQHMRNMSMQNNLNINKMSSRHGLRQGISETKLEHVNTSGTLSRIPSAERHRGLWPNMQDQINQSRQLLNDKLENRPKFNFSLNKMAKRDDPRSFKMEGMHFSNTI